MTGLKIADPVGMERRCQQKFTVKCQPVRTLPAGSHSHAHTVLDQVFLKRNSDVVFPASISRVLRTALLH